MKNLLFAILILTGITAVNAQGPLYKLRGHTDLITGVAFADDSKTLASVGSWENKVYIWNAAGAAQIKTISVIGQCMSAAFLSKSKLVTTSGNDVVIVDIDKGIISKTLNGHTETAWHVTLNKSKTLIASGGWDNNCIIWDVKKGKKKKVLTGHTSYINRVSFSVDGKQVATASEDQTVKVWDVKTGKLIKTLTDHVAAASEVVYSPDGKYLVTGGDDNATFLYSTDNYERIATLPDQKDKVRAIAFSADGSMMAIGAGSEAREVNVYKAGTWNRIIKLTGPDSFVNNLTFSPDGKYLAGASSDKNVYIWDASKFLK
jgi:WD40 repeat protein